MLMSMQKKVTEEGKTEEALFEKFMCYCKTGTGQLEDAIQAAEVKIPQVENNLEASNQVKAQQDADVKQHEADSAAAKSALSRAESLRETEAGQFETNSNNWKTNIAAITKALEALKAGTGESFLQTGEADRLRQLIVDADMDATKRDKVASFLSQGEDGADTGSSHYEPKSGEIIGILRTMRETMEQDLAKATTTEEQSIADYNDLVKAKNKEIDALTKAIEAKLESSGLLGVEIVQLREDLEDTKDTLVEDKKYAAELGKGCSTRKQEWEARKKLRTEELLAISDTIKLLNDDDALDLFKKTLPGAAASFLQIQVHSAALQVLHQGKKGAQAEGRLRLSLAAITLRHGTKSFDKVIKMIETMIGCLHREQESDDNKKEYCEQELDKAEDEKKNWEQANEDKKKAMDDAIAAVETLAKEVKELSDGIQDLDKNVIEATQQRKEENSEYKETMATNTAALQILKMAKNRMAKFYSPKEYQPETLLAQGAQGAAPPPPPETFDAYKKKNDESSGVMEMMDTLISDLDAQITEMSTEEKEAQAEYEEMVQNAKTKRTADSKAIAEKEGSKATLEAQLQNMAVEKKDIMKELSATNEIIADLHKECDWLLSNHELRRAARDGEIDSLHKAQAILQGADFEQ